MKRPVLITAIIVLVIAIAAAYWYVGSSQNPKTELSTVSLPESQERGVPTPTTPFVPPAESLTPTPVPPMVNFAQTGNIVNTDPLKSSIGPDFSLLYDKPGSPATKTDLVFNTGSKCDLGQGLVDCSKVKLDIGLRVKVQGILDKNKVVVTELVKTN